MNYEDIFFIFPMYIFNISRNFKLFFYKKLWKKINKYKTFKYIFFLFLNFGYIWKFFARTFIIYVSYIIFNLILLYIIYNIYKQ